MSNTSSPDDFVNKLCENRTLSVRWIDIYLKPRRTVNLVEGCVIVAASFLLILSVLGPWRCRSRNVVVQYAVRGAHLLSFPLLSYTMGLMQGVIKNELYSVWALFLVLLFAGANSVSAQKLDENKQWLKLFVDNSLYLGYVILVLGSTINIPVKQRYGPPIFMLLISYPLDYLLSLRNTEMLLARVLASDPQWNGSPGVDRNMKYNPRSMEGYNYLVFPLTVDLTARPSQVDVQRARSELNTLEKIWCHGNSVLSMDNPAIHHLKDVCLSLALFRLTVRRYFGYACPESGLDKTRDLVLQGLLDESCDRAFQVIELELTFLYEFFFTKYAIIVYIGVIRSIAVSVVTTTIIISLGTYSLTHLKRGENSLRFGLFVEMEIQDVIVTKLILWSLFQLLQIWIYCLSN
ncbi:hypothetical protein C2845_PM10G14500 [Panicum miliaceum]|uniref:DUF4220 domain-containing protein n=1 Tax=Panicum miliaceum TaxID=4540 RepID=A0A3L6PC20_PANMI|nr:hypothetical protein C2845_PM10G14500 [Panicum miliaceum]